MTLVIPRIDAINDAHLRDQLISKINNKTKPLGALGALETLAIKLGMVLQSASPTLVSPQVVVFAADHGIAQRGVSAYPSDVTWQMVENFLADGAAVSVLARQHAVSLSVVDCGVQHDFEPRERLIISKTLKGTADSTAGVAMPLEDCLQAMANGQEIIDGLPGNVFIPGEMGIGNTSAASLLMSKLTGMPIEQCTGAGTGLAEDAVTRKIAVLREALGRHSDVSMPIDVLAAVGGLEIATMVGAMLAAAASRRVILVDGFIVSAAVLVAAKIDPTVQDYCVFAHRSKEKGHRWLLDHLNAQPLLDLGLRLGEGSGALLAWPLLQSACLILNEMASFESAGVDRESLG